MGLFLILIIRLRPGWGRSLNGVPAGRALRKDGRSGETPNEKRVGTRPTPLENPTTRLLRGQTFAQKAESQQSRTHQSHSRWFRNPGGGDGRSLNRRSITGHTAISWCPRSILERLRRLEVETATRAACRNDIDRIEVGKGIASGSDCTEDRGVNVVDQR